MVRKGPPEAWTAGATIADASPNRRMNVRLGDAIAYCKFSALAVSGVAIVTAGHRRMLSRDTVVEGR